MRRGLRRLGVERKRSGRRRVGGKGRGKVDPSMRPPALRRHLPRVDASTSKKSRHGRRSAKLVAGKQKAAGLDRFGEAAANRAQDEGGNGAFGFDRQRRRFTGEFEAAVELQARLLEEFR